MERKKTASVTLFSKHKGVNLRCPRQHGEGKNSITSRLMEPVRDTHLMIRGGVRDGGGGGGGHTEITPHCLSFTCVCVNHHAARFVVGRVAVVTRAHLLDLGLGLHVDELPLPGEGSLQPGEVLLTEDGMISKTIVSFTFVAFVVAPRHIPGGDARSVLVGDPGLRR